MHIFLLISFIFAKKYCVQKYDGQCEERCKHLQDTFDEKFNYYYNIPNDAVHDVYIADDIDFYDTNHNIISCDSSITLRYNRYVTSILIKDYIYADSVKIPKNFTTLFNINNDFNITVETYEKRDIGPIILDPKYNVHGKVHFTNDFIPENLISIYSGQISLPFKTDSILKLFNNTEKLIFYSYEYQYCLSDKENKCKGYNQDNLTMINSTSQINYPCILIVDTSDHQYLHHYYYNNYWEHIHIIALSGSDISFDISQREYDNNDYVYLHGKSVETNYLLFEGDGKLTLIMNSNFTLHSTAKTNDIHLKLKSKYPFKVDRSYIYALTDDSQQFQENKIQVEPYSLFYGPKSLLGLFEPGKYICEDDFLKYNVTVSDLKEYPYDRITYYFAKGEHEFPTEWRVPCDLYAIDNNETTFIFNDVYSFVGSDIDNFIYIHDASANHSMITIKPAHIFYLNSFELKKYARYNKKYTIQVDKDFQMDGYVNTYSYDIEEYSHNQCKIVGNGTIKFSNNKFMENIKRLCNIDEGIELKYENLYSKPHNICIGQSDLEKCKSEISGIETFENTEWLWIRNIRTVEHINIYLNTIYFTDKLEFFNDYANYYSGYYYYYYHNYNIILTPNSSLTIPYKYINMYKKKINNIEAQNSSAKLTYIYTNDNGYSDYDKYVFQIYYYDAPSDIDFQVYFYNENIKLFMRYLENFTNESIKLNGTGVIHIREPYITRIPIFSRPDTLNIRINEDNYYHQLCYSYKPVEYNSLYDFLLCPNYETFVELDNATWSVYGTYVFYLNISLTLNSNSYRCKSFYFFDNITVECDLPNNPILIFDYNIFEIVNEYNYYFYFQFENSYPTKFIFDVKDTIVLDYTYSFGDPLIEFTSFNKSLEIIPSCSIRKCKLYENRRIKVPNSFTIYSPAPQYLYNLFNSTSIYFSSRWNYLYISESGRKSFYESILEKSYNFDKYNPEENPIKNIVLAVGNNDTIAIPSNWDDSINVFILQDEVSHIDRPLNLSFCHESVILNHKFKIIVGDMNITLPESFTVDLYMRYDNKLHHYLYQTILDCSQNERTDLFTGSVLVEWAPVKVVDIYRNNDSKLLQINVQNESDLYDLNLVMHLNSDSNVKYHFNYDFICYAYSESRCNGKFFFADSFLGLYNAMQDYPELNITVADNIVIPYTTGDHFMLNIIYDDIRIELPQYPDSLNIMENNIISFNYSDSTIIEISNKSIIKVELMDYVDIEFEADTDSDITFILESDVFVSTKSNFVPNFSISIINNSYHLYSYDVKLFGNMFNGLLEPYIQMCAYGSDASSLCSFPNADTIENIFKEPFDCNEVEIALLSTPCEIKLPSVSHSVFLNILPNSTTTLTIQEVSNIQIIPDFVIINEKWHFDGDRSVLSLKLNKISSLSISEQMQMPITFQLTSKETLIDLKDFDIQNSSQITILKYGDETNEIIVFGPNETYYNFINAVKHDGIDIRHNGTQKYLCICNSQESCDQCRDGIDGIIIPTNEVKNDPGENVKIRIFSDIEIPSKIFTNEHDVLINYDYTLNLTNIDTVYQNIESGLKVDNLIFVNGTNILLKPTEPEIKIMMRKESHGPSFVIEMEDFLKLNVPNIEEEDVQASLLYVNGYGELNIYDYPARRIRGAPTVKVIKGVYIICGSSDGSNICSYNSAYGYKEIERVAEFKEGFDADSKIVVFLNSFTRSINANIGHLKNQKIQFIKRVSDSPGILDDEIEEEPKVRFTNTSELTNKADSTTKISGFEGGALLDNADSDSFIVGFNENLTIKQEGDLSSKANTITIQPMSEKAKIFIDDSVDIYKQKLKIESDSEHPIDVTIVANNKDITSEELLKNFIETDDKKININIGESSPKKGFPIGAIVGIVAGVIVVVAIVVVTVIVVTKKKKEDAVLSYSDVNEFDDSTF